MRYSIRLETNELIDVHAPDFRVVGRRRIKCFRNLEDSYPLSEKSIDISFTANIEKITDSHGREVYKA